MKPLMSYEEIFGAGELAQEQSVFTEENEIKVVMLPIEKLQDRKGHSYTVRDDMKMAELVESVRERGILQPCLVTAMSNGNYEIVAGHRRRRAALWAGLKEVPAIIRKEDVHGDNIDEVDTNINRGEPSPMEKARAYKKKLEAQKQINKAENLTKRPDQILAEEMKESRNQIQRYIRLNYLITELQEALDKNQIQFIPAVEISYLSEKEQEQLFFHMEKSEKKLSLAQAVQLKEASKQGALNETLIKLLLQEKSMSPKVTLNHKVLKQFFPANYGKDEIETVIFTLLENWNKENRDTSDFRQKEKEA